MDTINEDNINPYILFNIRSVHDSFTFHNVDLISIRLLRHKCVIVGKKENGTNAIITIRFDRPNYPATYQAQNYTWQELHHYNLPY